MHCLTKENTGRAKETEGLSSISRHFPLSLKMNSIWCFLGSLYQFFERDMVWKEFDYVEGEVA